MRRHDYWPGALERVIDKARTKRFRRGRHDCALFVAACIKAMTGADYGAPFRGKYNTKEGAAMMLRERGAETPGDYASVVLGQPVSHREAGRGDVAEFMTPEGPSIGIIDNSGRRIVTVADEGVIFIDKKNALRAWRV